jgi:hypothetical protein
MLVLTDLASFLPENPGMEFIESSQAWYSAFCFFVGFFRLEEFRT